MIVVRATLGKSQALAMPPPLLRKAEFPLRVLLLTITEATEKADPLAPFTMPPPAPSLPLAKLKLRVLLVTINFAAPSKAEFAMAPPLNVAELLLSVHLCTLNVPLRLKCRLQVRRVPDDDAVDYPQCREVSSFVKDATPIIARNTAASDVKTGDGDV